MCPAFGLVLSVITLSVCNGYSWYRPYSGSETGACPGDNVTIPWEFYLYDYEQLDDLVWYFQTPEGSEELIGTYFHGRFIPSSSTRQHLSFNISEGLTISGVTQADYGTYTVHLAVDSGGYLSAETRHTYLQPPRSPDIRNQELVARILPAVDYGSGDWRVQLGCGYFYSTGDQYFTVMWKTPSSRIRTDGYFQNGEFVLTLDNPVHEEGIYSCQLLFSNSTTAWCARTNSAFDFSASVHVDTSAVQFAILNGRLNAMQQELNYLHNRYP